MPLPKPAPRQHMHTRQIQCAGFKRDDDLWDIEATLTDTKSYAFENHDRGEIEAGKPVHLMHLRVTLNLDLVIQDIASSSDYTPFRLCKKAEKAMQSLVGLQIGSGWMKEARKRVPFSVSCTHLFELLGPVATTAYQTMHWAIEEREKQKSDRQPLPILDTCISLGRHTAVVKAEWPEFYQPK